MHCISLVHYHKNHKINQKKTSTIDRFLNDFSVNNVIVTFTLPTYDNTGAAILTIQFPTNNSNYPFLLKTDLQY